MAELDFTDCPGNKPSLTLVDNRKRDLWRFYKGATLVSKINYLGQRYSTAGDQYRYVQVGIKDIAANNDAFEYPLLNFPAKVTINSIFLAVDTTVASDSTNYQTIAATDDADNSIASITTATTGFTEGTARTMGDIDSTHGILSANEGLKLTFTKSGTGMAFSGMTVFIAYTINEAYTNGHTIDEDDPPLMAWIDSPDASEVILSDRDAGEHIDLNNGAFKVSLDGKAITTSVDRYFSITSCLGDIDVSGPTPAKFAIFKPSAKCRAVGFYIGADTTVTLSSDSNYLTITFDKYDTSSELEIARCSTSGPYASGTALTLGEFTKIADYLDGDMVELNTELSSTDYIWVTLAKTGTGGTNLSNLTVQVLYEKLE